MAAKYLFVGERRSRKAVRMGVRWEDGRLAAAQLFDALEAAGIDPRLCRFQNWFERGGPAAVRASVLAGSTVIGMGRKVQAALEKAGIGHLALVHPAARGAIRKKERYKAHVREVLGPRQGSGGTRKRVTS